MSDSNLVAAAASTTVNTAHDPVLRNLMFNALLVVIGAILGGVVVFFATKLIRRLRWASYPHTLVVLDACLVVLVTVLTSSFGLWRPETWQTLSPYSGAAYLVTGMILCIGVGSKWLLSVAKEISKEEVQKLRNEATEAKRDRNAHCTLEALAREAMRAKLARLVAEYKRPLPPPSDLAAALAPQQQLHQLIQVLHRQVMRHVKTPGRLRIGVYVLSDDEKSLEPGFSWDGENKDVFSGKHTDFMNLNAPGGGRSVVVQAWHQNDPFVFVADTAVAERSGTFTFFRQEHRAKICSMVAYRHNLRELSANEAFIITLDSDQSGLFSADVEQECRLLLPAFSVRIELELLASYLSPSSSQST